jgi:hypothetical protein
MVLGGQASDRLGADISRRTSSVEIHWALPMLISLLARSLAPSQESLDNVRAGCLVTWWLVINRRAPEVSSQCIPLL